MKLRRHLVAVCLLSLSVTPAFADKATDAIDKAKALYEQGNIGKAYSELQIATTFVGRKLRVLLEKTFPATPAGWKTRPTRSNNQAGLFMMSQGFTMTRRYRQDGGRGQVTAQLIVDNPMITTMAGLFSNPAMATRMNYDRQQIDGVGEAWVKFQDQRKRGEVVLVLAGRIFIKITGRNIENADVLVKLISTWDIASLKKHIGMS